MPNLIREKRVDKNGVVNTKLVSAAPRASNAALRVPAPSLGGSASSRAKKGVEKPFKPRPAQVKQQHYSLAHGSYRISPEMLATMEFAVPSGGNRFYSFEASEVEMYAVLSVTTPGDAMELLQRGVRTAADAKKYLNRRKMKSLVKDHSMFAEEALKRNLSSYDFFENFDQPRQGEHDSPFFMDAMEVKCSGSLSEQYAWVRNELLEGEMRLSDIKAIGFSKLKPFRRLYYSRDALRELQEPDAKFNIDDLKMVVERAAKEGVKEAPYRAAVEYLIHEGPEFFEGLESLKKLHYIDSGHSVQRDRFERTKYEMEFRKLDEYKYRSTDAIMSLYEEDVPAEEAVRLINEGVPLQNIVGIVKGGIEKPLAEGWL